MFLIHGTILMGSKKYMSLTIVYISYFSYTNGEEEGEAKCLQTAS